MDGFGVCDRRSVSIHAALRAATGGEVFTITDNISFNPRGSASRDMVFNNYPTEVAGFNPRGSASRDYCEFCRLLDMACFNPRGSASRDRL